MRRGVPTGSAPRPRFLSEADCREVTQRLARFATGGGYTSAQILSTWTGNVRWARNAISASGEVQDNTINVTRNVRGAQAAVLVNDTTDEALVAAARRAERLAGLQDERPNTELITRRPLEPILGRSVSGEGPALG